MPSVEVLKELEGKLWVARTAAQAFFQACSDEAESSGVEHFGVVPERLSRQGKELSNLFHAPLVRIATHVRHSPMFGGVDLQAVQQAVRQIDAALRLRRFQEWDPEVIHDEGTVLGVRPAGFSEDTPLRAQDALAAIDDALDQVDRRLSVLIAEAEAAYGAADVAEGAAAGSVPVRPGTAFIMMMMDPAQPDLEDLKATIREEFARVGIRAIRADDIEHSGEITHRILDEIRNAEFLIADLSGERPSVYYEIGYAHAVGKRVILYRKKGSRLHFDLAVHNCPEYTNFTDLRDKLRKRLAALTNREE
jgi:hypothetical protein